MLIAHRQRIRALVIAVGAGAAATLLLACCRPTSVAADPADPTSAVVVASCWLAWALGGYLLLAFAAEGAVHLPGAIGRVAAALRPLAPRFVRHAVRAGMGASVTAAVVAAPSAAFATTPAPPLPQTAAPTLTSPSPLEWPGLTAAKPPPAKQRAPIVVRPGDSLWRLTADLLGPDATPRRIADTWPRLYAENRHVVGADPNLIHPGQRLVPPPPQERTLR